MVDCPDESDEFDCPEEVNSENNWFGDGFEDEDVTDPVLVEYETEIDDTQYYEDFNQTSTYDDDDVYEADVNETSLFEDDDWY